VHNVRIEHLGVDVTAQVGTFWAEMFTQLELQHGLDINNIQHIWLLHHLFLSTINQQLAFFADAWNQHRIQLRDGPNHSPADLFGFNMMVHGICGDQLPEDLTEEELEVYRVDWEVLCDERLLQSQHVNNSDREGWSSWVGQTGPPENLNEVFVEPPVQPLSSKDNLKKNKVLIPPSDNGCMALKMLTLSPFGSMGLPMHTSMYGDLF
jgi:hypothetical protein